MQLVVYVARNLVEEGNSARGVCRGKSAGRLLGLNHINGHDAPAARLMPSRMSGRAWKMAPRRCESSAAAIVAGLPCVPSEPKRLPPGRKRNPVAQNWMGAW